MRKHNFYSPNRDQSATLQWREGHWTTYTELKSLSTRHTGDRLLRINLEREIYCFSNGSEFLMKTTKYNNTTLEHIWYYVIWPISSSKQTGVLVILKTNNIALIRVRQCRSTNVYIAIKMQSRFFHIDIVRWWSKCWWFFALICTAVEIYEQPILY